MKNKTLKTFALTLGVLYLIAAAVPFLQAGEKGKVVTIKGEVLDSACYFSHGARSEKHKKCAQNCANKGIPLALIDDDGTVYLLNEDHAKADAYKAVKKKAGEVVTVKGKLIEKDGWKVLYVYEVQ